MGQFIKPHVEVLDLEEAKAICHAKQGVKYNGSFAAQRNAIRQAALDTIAAMDEDLEGLLIKEPDDANL